MGTLPNYFARLLFSSYIDYGTILTDPPCEYMSSLFPCKIKLTFLFMRYTCLTLDNFCLAVHQIGYDMKRCVIAEDRVI